MDPGSVAYQNRMNRHLIRLGGIAPTQGMPGEALEAAHQVAARMASNPLALYNTACILSRCLPLAKDPAERDQYGDEAMQVLDSAVKAGWTNASWAARDPDLLLLQNRPDFRRLIAELFDRGFPVGSLRKVRYHDSATYPSLTSILRPAPGSRAIKHEADGPRDRQGPPRAVAPRGPRRRGFNSRGRVLIPRAPFSKPSRAKWTDLSWAWFRCQLHLLILPGHITDP